MRLYLEKKCGDYVVENRIPEIRHIGCGESNMAVNRHTHDGVMRGIQNETSL